jgi:hypothetical protein
MSMPLNKNWLFWIKVFFPNQFCKIPQIQDFNAARNILLKNMSLIFRRWIFTPGFSLKEILQNLTILN